MISVRKYITYLVLIAIFVSEYGSVAWADESLHSLEELPSMSTEVSESPDDFSALLREKQVYEQVAPVETPEVIIPEELTVSASALLAEREIYVARSTSESILTPVMTPGFITDPMIGQLFGAENAVSGFLATYTSPSLIEKQDTTGHIRKERKVGTTRGTISTSITPGTIITTSTGLILDSSVLDIASIPDIKKVKAKKNYEKKMKNRGNIKKGRAEAVPQGFEFGLSGTHLIFSSPVTITVDMPNASDGIMVDLMTEHAGDTDFHTIGLSVDAATTCNTDGSASLPGSSAIVKNGKITFYTCGASLFTMNPSGGTAGSNDLKIYVGDCSQVQIYYNNLSQVYTGNPPGAGCSTGSNMDAWPVLRVGTTSYGNDFTAWASSTTTGTTVGNTYTAVSTMTTPLIGGRTYQLIIDWSHTAPNKYFTWSWRVVVPVGNTLPIKFYYGMDSMVAGGDPNDVGYLSSTGGLTVGIYDGTANVLSAFRYLSGPAWTAHQANGWNTVRTQITNGANFTNVVQLTGGDLGFGVNWDFGTPAAGTLSGAIEWRVAPYVSANVVDLVPGIGQPEGPLTIGFSSQLPITLSNVGNLASSGVHTAVLTLPATISGPASPFSDNGWSCGAQAGATVTCTKTTSIAPLGDDTFRIQVIPLPGSPASVNFNLAISNPSDSNTTNNTAFATNSVVAAAPTIAPGGVTGAGFWSKADGGKNCTATGCTITTWFNSGTVAINAVTGLGTVTYDPTTQINYNPTLYFNNASLNINNNLALPTRANSIFVVSRIGTGGNFYIGTQTATNNTRSWRTSPTTDQWMRYNSTVFYNGANNRAANVPAITSTVRQTAGASAGYTNGRSILTSASNLTFTVNNLSIGRNAATNSTLSSVAEVIIYNTALTALQQNQVESYLALKYGITLDQTTAENYILAGGTITSWDAALAGVYNQDIAGVARDDATSLNQQKSQSINNAGDLIVNTVGAIGANARALIWANDGTATGSWISTDVPTGYERITREWQFQEKNGNIGNVKIAYPVASVPAGFTGTLMMLVDSDSTFATGPIAYTGTLSAGNWEFTVDVADMAYMTFAKAIVTDTTPPVISGSSIASGTLIPIGNFSLTYNYSDIGSAIAPATATGNVYSWNSGTLSYDAVALTGYMTLGSSALMSATMNIANLPFGRYRFDLSIADTAGNISTRSFTYFVDAIEWTISADTYNIGNITQNIASFGTGELVVTVKTVGAGFALTSAPSNPLAIPAGDTINYWNGTYGVGYDIWNGSAFLGNIITYSPNTTLATVVKNINTNGDQNTFTYRIKYGAQVDFMQKAGDYNGTVQFGLLLDY